MHDSLDDRGGVRWTHRVSSLELCCSAPRISPQVSKLMWELLGQCWLAVTLHQISRAPTRLEPNASEGRKEFSVLRPGKSGAVPTAKFGLTFNTSARYARQRCVLRTRPWLARCVLAGHIASLVRMTHPIWGPADKRSHKGIPTSSACKVLPASLTARTQIATTNRRAPACCPANVEHALSHSGHCARVRGADCHAT